MVARSIVASVLLLTLLTSAGVRLFAQAAQAAGGPQTFEAASVKPNTMTQDDVIRAITSGSTFPLGIRTSPGGRLTATRVTVKALILRAYGIRDFQLEGGPKWIESDNFDIVATAGREATDAELNAMLKSLLAERFGLRTHANMREGSIYVVTLARPDGRLGPGLQPTTPECDRQQTDAKPGAPPPALPRGQLFAAKPICGVSMMMLRSAGGAASMMMGGQEMSRLMNQISNELGAPVTDHTGLAGRFDVTLDYESRRLPAGLRGGLDPNGSDSAPLPLREAVQQQLGLKIEEQKGAIDMTVIDAVDHPQPD